MITAFFRPKNVVSRSRISSSSIAIRYRPRSPRQSIQVSLKAGTPRFVLAIIDDKKVHKHGIFKMSIYLKTTRASHPSIYTPILSPLCTPTNLPRKPQPLTAHHVPYVKPISTPSLSQSAFPSANLRCTPSQTASPSSNMRTFTDSLPAANSGSKTFAIQLLPHVPQK
jgi:hypothetical protein